YRSLKTNITEFYLLLAAICAAVLESRAFLFGFTVSFVITGLILRSVSSFRTIIIRIGILSIFLFALISVVKVSSSHGRLLVYKITWNMFTDHFPGGIGL